MKGTQSMNTITAIGGSGSHNASTGAVNRGSAHAPQQNVTFDVYTNTGGATLKKQSSQGGLSAQGGNVGARSNSQSLNGGQNALVVPSSGKLLSSASVAGGPPPGIIANNHAQIQANKALQNNILYLQKQNLKKGFQQPKPSQGKSTLANIGVSQSVNLSNMNQSLVQTASEPTVAGGQKANSKALAHMLANPRGKPNALLNQSHEVSTLDLSNQQQSIPGTLLVENPGAVHLLQQSVQLKGKNKINYAANTHVYSGQAPGTYQKKMMLKNSNQLRSSYNSVTAAGPTQGAHSAVGMASHIAGYQKAIDAQSSGQGFSMSRGSQLSQKLMPQNMAAMPQGASGKNNKSSSLSVYGKKSTSKGQSKDRYQDIGRIYNYDYSTSVPFGAGSHQSSQNLQHETIQPPTSSGSKLVLKGQPQTVVLQGMTQNPSKAAFNTIGHSGAYTGSASKKILNTNVNIGAAKQTGAINMLGTVTGSSQAQGAAKQKLLMSGVHDGQHTSKRSGTGGTSSQAQNLSTQQLSRVNQQNVYMAGVDSYSNEDRSAGGSSMSNILAARGGVNRSFNIGTTSSAQPGQKVSDKIHGALSSSSALSKASLIQSNKNDGSEAANYNDSGLLGMQGSGFVSAGRRQRPIGQNQNSAQPGGKSSEGRAQSRASSKNGKVGLKKNLITSSVQGSIQQIGEGAQRTSQRGSQMPNIDSSGRSGLSGLAKAPQGVQAKQGAFLNNRGSVKKDTNQQTITLLPSASNVMLTSDSRVNIADGGEDTSAQRIVTGKNLPSSLDYEEQRSTKSRKDPDGRRAGLRSNNKSRDRGAKGSQRKPQHDNNEDIVNYSPHGAVTANGPLQKRLDEHGLGMDANDEEVQSLTQGKLFAGRDSVPPLSLNSNAIEVTRQQLCQQLDQLHEEQNAFTSALAAQQQAAAQAEEAQKQKKVKASYDDQKKKQFEDFAQRHKTHAFQLDHNKSKLMAITDALSQLSAHSDVLGSVLGPVVEELTSMAGEGFGSMAKMEAESTVLQADMTGQAREFYKRYSNVKQRNESSDKVLSEMKKQLTCYKEEIENMKKMEAHLTVENYQKLVNDFNQLYDHYKMHKQMSKKLKVELSQSNHRERTFLKLLKKTAEFGDQAAQLEKEYDKLYENGEAEFNLSNEQKFIDVTSRKIPIPMLDLSIIHIQQQEGNGDTSTTNQEEIDQGQLQPNEDEIEQDPNEALLQMQQHQQQLNSNDQNAQIVSGGDSGSHMLLEEGEENDSQLLEELEREISIGLNNQNLQDNHRKQQ